VFVSFVNLYQGQWSRKNRKGHLKNMCSSFDHTFPYFSSMCKSKNLRYVNIYKVALKVAYFVNLFSVDGT
jgi:hypothetical protein